MSRTDFFGVSVLMYPGSAHFNVSIAEIYLGQKIFFPSQSVQCVAMA